MPISNCNFGLEEGGLADVFPSRADGRKIATWKFVQSAPAGRKAFEIDVFLLGRDALRFRAVCKELLPQGLEDSDIESLRQKVFAVASEQARQVSQIQWEDWLEVITDGEDSELGTWHGWGSSLKVHVNRIKRGVDPVSGRVLTLLKGGGVTDFPSSAKLDGTELRHMGRLGSLEERTPERAYVPDTPEVREALQDIFSRMRALRDRLARALSHDSMAQALAAGSVPRLDWKAVSSEDESQP